MARLARLPLGRGAPDDSGADLERVPRLRTRYYAFLSYSHQDKDLADWLHRELEKFRVPSSIAGRLTASGVVPRRLTPIFRDQHDLSASGDLAEEIKAALAASQFLVVLCSPTAAKSRWTNQEIESFKRTRPEGCVLAAIASGEPFASDAPGREAEECFPPALRYRYDRRGRPTNKRAEPLAADLRGNPEERRTGFLKLVAGMLGVGLDELVQRETTRRHRHLAWLAAASLGGMAVTSTLAVTAINARNEAREQRREAEGLVGFMLGDLKNKLEPIGRLDALDGVGARVLRYYQKQGTADLSDAALSQRSKALSLMAEVAESRGDSAGALRLYRTAMAGTAEAARRAPNDPQALFDHAQNVFYVGQIDRQLGDFKANEAAMREYKDLAIRMIALGPDSMKWRMEKNYADTNLGVALADQRRFPEAVEQFSEALTTMKAIATADPRNREYQQNLAEGLAWLADAQGSMGDYRGAIASRTRGIATLQRLFDQTGDVDYEQRLVPAHVSLGYLYLEQGQAEAAGEEFRTAVAMADALLPKEPTNTTWREYATKAHLALARQLLVSGRKDEAAVRLASACQLVDTLLRRNPAKPEWRVGSSRCLALQSQIALAGGDRDQALKLAQANLAVARTVHRVDPVSDSYLVAAAYRLLGDARRAAGNAQAAKDAWTAALAQLPASAVEEPDQLAEHAAILDRLGRSAEAQPLRMKLQKIGYRLPS